MPKPLSIVLALDALIGVGFGLASILSPESTYATIVDLRHAAPDSLIASALSGQSVFYVLIGLVAAVALTLPATHQRKFAAILLLRHLWVGAKGVTEMDRPWLIGDPWPDLIVHTVFVLAYAAAMAWSLRRPA